VDRPTPPECQHYNGCSSSAKEVSGDVRPHSAKPLLPILFPALPLKRNAMNSQ
jgi:hypothetical protein